MVFPSVVMGSFWLNSVVFGSNLVTDEFLMVELPCEEDGEIFNDMDMWVGYAVKMMSICEDR